MLIGLFVLFQIAFAQSPQILLEIRQKNPAAFAHAESLYNSTHDSGEQARLATLLAFAPEDKVQVKPYLYAAYAAQNDSSLALDLKLKLLKLSGEGFYSNGQFQKAKSLFETALNTKNLSEADQEYFQYQIAWCDLNLKNQFAAYQRLSSWIKTCSLCRLKKDIVKDMGRSLGEAYLSHKVFQPQPMDDALADDFVAGFAASLEREKKIDPVKMIHILPSNFTDSWLTQVFKGPYKACTKVDIASQYQELVVPTPELKQALVQCPNQKSAAVFLSFKQFAPEDFILASEIFKKIGDNTKACELRIKASVPQNLNLVEYFNLLFSVCKHNLDVAHLPAQPQFYISALRDQSPWLKTYLSLIADDTVMRTEFEKQNWIANYPMDQELAKTLVEDSRFSPSFRLAMWQKNKGNMSLDENLIYVLNQDLKNNKTEFLNSLSLASPNKTTCLVLTLNNQDSLKNCLAADHLLELSSDDQLKLFNKLVERYGLAKIIESWDHFSPIVEHNDQLLLSLSQNSLSQFEKLNDPVANKMKLAQRLLHSEPIAESSPDIQAIQKVQSVNQILINTPETEKGMAESANALRLLKTHHWSSSFYAEIYKSILKKGLNSFQSQLQKNKSLSQLSHLAHIWETRL